MIELVEQKGMGQGNGSTGVTGGVDEELTLSSARKYGVLTTFQGVTGGIS